MTTTETAACPYCAGEIVPGVQKCRHCGEWLQATPTASKGKREVKVRNYTNRRAMERDIKKMGRQGWQVQAQSGHFNKTPFLTRSLFSYATERDKVTVTYVRGG